jgi:hypothetical protein
MVDLWGRRIDVEWPYPAAGNSGFRHQVASHGCHPRWDIREVEP